MILHFGHKNLQIQGVLVISPWYVTTPFNTPLLCILQQHTIYLNNTQHTQKKTTNALPQYHKTQLDLINATNSIIHSPTHQSSATQPNHSLKHKIGTIRILAVLLCNDYFFLWVSFYVVATQSMVKRPLKVWKKYFRWIVQVWFKILRYWDLNKFRKLPKADKLILRGNAEIHTFLFQGKKYASKRYLPPPSYSS